MNVRDLVNELNGQRFGVTGPDFGQCTAVAHKWQRNLNLPVVYGDAYQIFDNAPDDAYAKIVNTPDAVPPPGAIIIWNANAGVHGLGPAGHVAVVVSADAQHFTSLDQNWPTGHAAQLVTHDYAGVKG